MSGARTIADVRAAFERAGDAIVDYARLHPASLDATVKVAYCPMLRKHWLQRGDAIENPYTGRACLTADDSFRAYPRSGRSTRRKHPSDASSRLEDGFFAVTGEVCPFVRGVSLREVRPFVRGASLRQPARRKRERT